MLKEQTVYRELGSNYFDQQDKEGVSRRWVKRLERLGYKISIEAAPQLNLPLKPYFHRSITLYDAGISAEWVADAEFFRSACPEVALGYFRIDVRENHSFYPIISAIQP